MSDDIIRILKTLYANGAHLPIESDAEALAFLIKHGLVEVKEWGAWLTWTGKKVAEVDDKRAIEAYLDLLDRGGIPVSDVETAYGRFAVEELLRRDLAIRHIEATDAYLLPLC